MNIDIKFSISDTNIEFKVGDIKKVEEITEKIGNEIKTILISFNTISKLKNKLENIGQQFIENKNK